MRRGIRIAAACLLLGGLVFGFRPFLDLLLASQAGADQPANIARLLSLGADPNCRQYEAGAAMKQAVYQDHPDVVKQLIQAGADPNLPLTDGGDTALMLAATDADHPVITELIAAKADVWATDKACKTALDFSVTDDDLVGQEIITAAQNSSTKSAADSTCHN